MGLLDDMFGGGAEKRAAEKNRQLYDSYGTQGNQYLDQGYNTGVTNLNNAVGSFQSLADLGTKYGGASSMLLNSLGVNGAAGNQAATAAFQNSPGYQYTVDQALGQTNRAANVAGMLNGGNTLAALQDRAKSLANQDYQSWQSGLSGFTSPELQATSGAATGRANGYTDLASLAQNNATNKTGLLGQVTTGQVGANNLQAQGEASGAKNLLGLGTSLASMAMGVPGGMGGGGLSSLWGLGGGSGITYGGPNGPTAFYKG